MVQDLFENLPYVKKRGDKFAVRVPVPKDVRMIVGKNEITRTLGTGDPKKAKFIYHEVLAKLEAEFSAARLSLSSDPAPILTVEMATQFAIAHFQREFSEMEMQAHKILRDPELDYEATQKRIKETILDIDLDMEDFYRQGVSYSEAVADNILSQNGFPLIVVLPSPNAKGRLSKRVRKKVHVDRTAEGYLELLRFCGLGHTEGWQRMRAVLSGEEYSQSDSAFPKFSLSAQAANIENIIRQHSTQNSEFPIILGELFERFMDAHDNKSDRWKLDFRTALKPMFEILGTDVVADTLTKKDFRDVLAFIQRLPTNARKGKNRKGLSLREVVELNESSTDFDGKTLHPTTVKKYMGRIIQLMEWAVLEPLITHNHAKGIRISKAEQDNGEASRIEFSHAQLTGIFSDAIFTNPQSTNPSMYWASLISLFHGMRSEEILQLRFDDIKEVEGVRYLELHKRDGNHLKNLSAKRNVPVHPYMYELGFQSLVEMAGNRKDKRLFPDVARGSEGKYTSIFSQRYSRFLEMIGHKTSNTSFHSFRHNFRDAARNCEIPDDRVCAIGGWKFGAGTHTAYGSGISLSEKLKAIEKIQYPHLDFSRIKIIDWNR